MPSWNLWDCSSLKLAYHFYFPILNKFTSMLEIFVISMSAASTRDFWQKAFTSSNSTPSSAMGQRVSTGCERFEAATDLCVSSSGTERY